MLWAIQSAVGCQVWRHDATHYAYRYVNGVQPPMVIPDNIGFIQWARLDAQYKRSFRFHG